MLLYLEENCPLEQSVSPISPWIKYNWILKLIKPTFYFLWPFYKLSCIFQDILIIKSMFQLFKSTVNKQSCFKSDLPALLILDLMSPFFGFLYWFWKKRMVLDWNESVYSSQFWYFICKWLHVLSSFDLIMKMCQCILIIAAR